MRRHIPRLLPLAGVIAALVLAPVHGRAQDRYPAPPQDPYYGNNGPPQPRYAAELRVQVTPKQAAVYVDGYLAGQVEDYDGTFQRLHLDAGRHEIAIYLQGYRTLRELMFFPPNQTLRISGPLERLAAGEPDPGPPRPLYPPEAVDPFGAPQQSAAPGAPAPRSPSAPPSPRTPQSPAPRTPEPPTGTRPVSRFGTLSISVDRPGAELVIDGGAPRPVGATDERLLIQLTDGHHRVEVTKRGYQPYSSELDVRAGETADLDVTLTPDK